MVVVVVTINIFLIRIDLPTDILDFLNERLLIFFITTLFNLVLSTIQSSRCNCIIIVFALNLRNFVTAKLTLDCLYFFVCSFVLLMSLILFVIEVLWRWGIAVYQSFACIYWWIDSIDVGKQGIFIIIFFDALEKWPTIILYITGVHICCLIWNISSWFLKWGALLIWSSCFLLNMPVREVAMTCCFCDYVGRFFCLGCLMTPIQH